MSRNLFIALEGIDGSGKSTQAKLLAASLTAAGHNVYTTFEPSDGSVGTMVRSILRGSVKADNRTIAALFLADRLDHLLNETNGLLKMLAEGYTVVTDRFYFSSYAYHGTHMDMDWVIASNKICADILRPDMNIFIDVSPEVSMARITAGRETTELYETLDNLTNVRTKYLEAFDKLRTVEQILTVSGNQAPDRVAADIWQVVRERLS